MKPLISIVIPVYNAATFISKCLDSIINQSYTNLQVILVIDGAKDNSEEICRTYADKDSRFEIITIQNQGSAEARNIGLKYIKGKYVTFVDSDDYISLDYIEKLYTILNENKADISVLNFIYFKDKVPENRIISNSIETFETKEEFDNLFCKLYKGSECFSFITPWAKLIPSEYFNDIRFPKGKCFDDEATMYLTYLKAKKIVYNNTQCYYYYYNDEGISKTIYKKNLQDFLPVLENRLEKFNSYGYPKAYAKTASKLFSKLITFYFHYEVCDKTKTITELNKISKIILNDKKSNIKDKIKCLLFILCPKGFLFYRKLREKKFNETKIN